MVERWERDYPPKKAHTLPHGWESMSLPALWNARNAPERRPTPQVIIEAVVYSARTRGISALKEPANIERLARCDDEARAEIDKRIDALRRRGSVQ
jgi:hypothetical protein